MTVKELPIYKINGRYYYRDTRLQEYRNIDNPYDRKPITSVLEKPSKEDAEIVFGKSLGCCPNCGSASVSHHLQPGKPNYCNDCGHLW